MAKKLHIFFFPMLGHGHMLPTIDMAKLFSYRGVRATMITTHSHVPMFEKAIARTKELGFDISVRAIKFPSPVPGLPEGIESLDQLKSDDLFPVFILATIKLQAQLEQLLEECHPDCLVADMFFPWATEAAAKFGIPRLLFGGTSTFAVCAAESLRRNRPFDRVSSDTEPFLVPEIPHEIQITRAKISVWHKNDPETEISKFFGQVRDSESKCYGVIVNSFYELEKDFVDYYTRKLGRKAWHLGPFLLCNKETEDKAQRGKESSIDELECLQWLTSKKPNSVVYVCFGSMANLIAAQLHEIAKGLEASGHDFIWVVRKCLDEEDSKKWFPEGFEDRIEGKGLIIRGWAPQLLILEHEAVGAFVTHCGWNSTLEGVCCGVPLVTWPMFAEQFMNEKMLTDVLKIGVGLGAKEWSIVPKDVIKGEALAKAVEKIMVGDEAIKIRGRSQALKVAAKKAVEEVGSSYSDFNALIQDLSAYSSTRN